MHSASTPSDLPNGRLREMLSEHIPYEHRMLDTAYNLLQLGIFEFGLKNALIESFWVHARNLIAFYTHPTPNQVRRYPWDVRASHFVEGGVFDLDNQLLKQAGGENTGEKLVDLVHRQIAHLTYHRTSGSVEKLVGIDMARIKLWIEETLDEFEACLTDEAQKLWRSPKLP